MAASSAFSIGRLSARTGCKIETIRYYERIGLIAAPPRSAGGYRLYRAGDARRLAFIRRARALGFAIGELRVLLRLADGAENSCARARALGTAHLSNIRGKIADLRRMATALDRMVARCARGKAGRCPLIEAIDRPEAALAAIQDK